MSGFWNMFGGRKSLRKSSQIGPPMFHLINTSPVFFQVCAPETVLWGVKGMIIGIQKYRNTKIILNKSTQNRGRSSLYFHFWAVFPQPEYTHTEMMLQKSPPKTKARAALPVFLTFGVVIPQPEYNKYQKNTTKVKKTSW